MLWLLVALLAPAHAGRKKAPEPPPLDEVAARLMGQAQLSDEAWEELVELADDIGARPAGSPQLQAAVEWGVAQMQEDGLDEVRAEPVTVPVWERGHTTVRITHPVQVELGVLTLGRSPGTPDGGIEAEVVVVDDFDHLESLGREGVQGKIVLYDEPWQDYGQAVQYRGRGPARAAVLGAVAALVRSPAPTSLYTPHTGGTWGGTEDEPTVPSVAVTLEDAARFRRWAERGITPRVHLDLGAHLAGEATSANAIGEVRGREKPEEIVVIGCHLDSWDVGTGAQDDGAGCVQVMEAARLIRELPWRPRRTIRVVLFTNEEMGLSGGKAYWEAHQGEPHFAALESDLGGGPTQGFDLAVRTGEERKSADLEASMAAMEPARLILDKLGAGMLVAGWGGSDIHPITDAGILGVGHRPNTDGYWPIHHTMADTIDKIDPADVRFASGAIAIVAWHLAELEERPYALPIEP